MHLRLPDLVLQFEGGSLFGQERPAAAAGSQAGAEAGRGPLDGLGLGQAVAGKERHKRRFSVFSFRFSVITTSKKSLYLLTTGNWHTGLCIMRVAVEAEDLAKAAQLGEDFRAVQGPLLPGPKDRVQRGVGEEQEGDFGVKAVQFTGQPAAAGLAHPEKRPAGAGAPGSMEAQNLQSVCCLPFTVFRKRWETRVRRRGGARGRRCPAGRRLHP